jgi:hypothetical protein
MSSRPAWATFGLPGLPGLHKQDHLKKKKIFNDSLKLHVFRLFCEQHVPKLPPTQSGKFLKFPIMGLKKKLNV